MRLHRDHLDVQANVKFDPRHAGLFGDVLHQRVELPIGRTWSRDVFYSVFGYGNSTFARELAHSGRDILRPVLQLVPLAQHRFLASVDYAAHSVKGEAYGPAVHGGLRVLMPHQFREYFRHLREATLSRTEVSVRLPEHVRVDATTLPGIRADRLLGMTAAQLDLLIESDEFAAYLPAYDIFLAYPRESRGEGLSQLPAALVAYLQLVSRVLVPPLDRMREDAGALLVEGRILRSGAKLLLQVLGPGAAGIDLLVQPLEVASKYLDRVDSAEGLLTASQERRCGLDTAFRFDSMTTSSSRWIPRARGSCGGW